MHSDLFAEIVTTAALAPSIHNAQPTRWRLVDGTIWVAVDLLVRLPQADPNGDGIALSCGAAVEATVLALSKAGFDAQVNDVWHDDDRHSWLGHRIGAMITYHSGADIDQKADGIAAHLPDRFTWRGAFLDTSAALFGWSRPDTVLVLDQPTKAWIAGLNDAASLGILRDAAFRLELLSWFRLTNDHPRASCDGMNLQALRMTLWGGYQLRAGFGPLWRLLDVFGRTKHLTAEASVTQTAAVIACFHCDKDASPVANGRAYLRLLLEATALGFASWPMAALTDSDHAAQQIIAQLSVPPDRQLVQVIRLGVPTGEQPLRARRPLAELAPN
jgi:nitroreductase